MILWLDYDREGEAIGMDIVDYFDYDMDKVYRARFSALTRDDLIHAMTNLKRPDKNLSDAVRVRQELDLRFGAIFTQF